MSRNYIVADVGGTHIRVACYPIDSHQPTIVKRISTKGQELPQDRLMTLIASIIPEDGVVSAITVAAPGPLDPYKGIIYEAPNIPEWNNLPLRQLLQDRFGVPVAIGNDANLAALGEWRYGAGVGHRHLVYITVSTGIGGGVIIDNHLLQGVHGLAGELGHITVLADGPVCSCGRRGHLEALTSGPSITRWVEQRIDEGDSSTLQHTQPITAKDVSLAACQGDKLAIDALDRAGTYLGIGIASILHIFNPTIIIIGGGVYKSGEPFFGPMRKAVSENVMSKKYLEDLTITTSTFGDDVGLRGALALAQTLEIPEPCQ